MARIGFVHWKPEEGEEGIKVLAAAGFEVLQAPTAGPDLFRALES